MAKDPAVLLYFDSWISATNGMKAEFRAWYLDLIIHQYDKGGIPNDMDEIAGICRVRPSEYNLFNQMVQQVLQQKFKLNPQGLWENDTALEILKKRGLFKEKRSISGNIGVIVKLAMTIKGFDDDAIKWLKNELFNEDPEKLDDYKNKQMLQQMLQLYINGNEDRSKGLDTTTDTDIRQKIKNLENYIGPDKFNRYWDLWKEFKKEQFKFKYKPIGETAALTNLKIMAADNDDVAIKIILQSIQNGWKGFFQLKKESINGTGNKNNGRINATDKQPGEYGKL